MELFHSYFEKNLLAAGLAHTVVFPKVFAIASMKSPSYIGTSSDVIQLFQTMILLSSRSLPRCVTGSNYCSLY